MVVSLRLSVAKDVYTIDLDCRRDCGVGSALRSGVVHVCRGLLLGCNGLSLVELVVTLPIGSRGR